MSLLEFLKQVLQNEDVIFQKRKNNSQKENYKGITYVVNKKQHWQLSYMNVFMMHNWGMQMIGLVLNQIKLENQKINIILWETN